MAQRELRDTRRLRHDRRTARDTLGDTVEDNRIDSETIAVFAARLKKKLADPGDPALRKNHVQAFVSEVVMTRERLTVRGPVASLVQAVGTPGAVSAPVRTSMVNWRTRQDSNLWPLPSEGSALSS